MSDVVKAAWIVAVAIALILGIVIGRATASGPPHCPTEDSCAYYDHGWHEVTP